MKRWSAWGLLWATGAGAQGTSPTLVYPDELLPTRMVLCQREVGGAERERDRSAKLRTCLARRLEGERMVERNCKRGAGSVNGASARAQAQRACERQALGVPSSELPRRPPPPPKPKAEPGLGTEPGAAAPARMPAAGDQ